ncbi:hypothetical protein [Candidatus Kuenenia stuttgartiensis]|uniref:hypothetical protein n=1 Tax=Kuenenia stuttgartiensis TaxID=174633 RepID=UPI00146BD237|nr:hypothetical protein [Candidatus Kuenenia stuttgartiensis]
MTGIKTSDEFARFRKRPLLLKKIAELLKDRVNIAVIEGDIQTDLDTQRIAKHGVPC